MVDNNIENKLKQYRIRKEKEKIAQVLASKPLWERYLPEKCTIWIKSYWNRVQVQPEIQIDDSNPEKDPSERQVEGNSLRRRKRSDESNPRTRVDEEVLEDARGSKPTNQTLDWLLTALKLLLWVVLFRLFVELEFGAVFVIFSFFYLILTNLRSGRRKPWEPSAYSVFNPGCEAIDGTLKAEQFEQELRHGF